MNEWVRCIGGMTLTRENSSSWGKPSPSAFHQEFDLDRPEIELWLPRWHVNDWPPETWRGFMMFELAILYGEMFSHLNFTRNCSAKTYFNFIRKCSAKPYFNFRRNCSAKTYFNFTSNCSAITYFNLMRNCSGTAVSWEIAGTSILWESDQPLQYYE
jgi:hypothetical protein